MSFALANGVLTSTVVGDIALIFATLFVILNYILPIAKLRQSSSNLEKQVGLGSFKKHWFFGHLRLFPPLEHGLLKRAQRTIQTPAWVTTWFGPLVSEATTHHSETAITLLASSAPKNEYVYKFLRPWLGDGLLVSNGKKWMRNRHLLTPAFHFSILKPYAEISNNCIKTMIEKWTTKTNVAFDIYKDVNSMTLDTMLQCAMSFKIEGLKERPLVVAYQLYTVYCGGICFLNFSEGSYWRHFKKRTLDIECISWSLYMLAQHPEYQQKCRDELEEVLKDKEDIDWSDLTKLQYLTMCIKETLRIRPPVPAISRQLDQPLTFKSKTHNVPPTTLAKGSFAGVQIFSLHRNVHVWEEPEVFNPDRFTQDNIKKRSPHAFLPFSAGSRNCIGQNFAMNEMKIAVGQIIRKYELYIDDDTPDTVMETALVLRSTNGIMIKIRKI
nr:leukotriene-B(4) omega-hydroxylase 2-like [Ciona intestinalis]|eukprot:XP_002123011.3 leukotriene-B(4) omega-hydroxylase 2-like [Ciona intestinalis]